jgi:hypothetical protein
MKVKTLLIGTTLALAGWFALASASTLKSPLFLATKLPKTSKTRGIIGSADATTTGKTRVTSGIKDSAGTGTRIVSRTGNGEARKATSGIKGSKGIGTRRITAGNFKARAWFVMPRVAIAVRAAISHPTVKVW